MAGLSFGNRGISNSGIKLLRRFNREDMVISDDSPQLPYRRRADAIKLSVGWGQFKLFLTNLLYINLFWDPERNPAPVFVYAGAAPGTHIALLATMFPQMTFHLYDPRAFDPVLHNKARIFLYNQLFTDREAEFWGGREDVLFNSDIRRGDYTQAESEQQNERMIMEDHAMQADWVRIMRPVQAMLKFRPPYAYDFILESSPTFRYLDGYVFLQPWAPQTSTETRLVLYPAEGGLYREREWEIKRYGDQLFHHNVITREQNRYLSPFTGQGGPILAPDLTNDFDSSYTTAILTEYLYKSGGEMNYDNFVRLYKVVMAALNAGKPKGVSVSSRRQLLLSSQAAAGSSSFSSSSTSTSSTSTSSSSSSSSSLSQRGGSSLSQRGGSSLSQRGGSSLSQRGGSGQRARWRPRNVQ